MYCRPLWFAAVGLLLGVCASPAIAQRPKRDGAKLEPNAAYACLLGMYGNDGKPTPFVTLNIPSGSNMLGDVVLSQMRGKMTIGEISYRATGYVQIPEDGTYEFDSNLGEIKLNGRDMGFQRKTGTIALKKGVYRLDIFESNHGQPYLEHGKLEVRLAGGMTPLPIFSTGKEIQRFMGTPIGGIKPILVSEFDPAAAKLDIKLPKR